MACVKNGFLACLSKTWSLWTIFSTISSLRCPCGNMHACASSPSSRGAGQGFSWEKQHGGRPQLAGNGAQIQGIGDNIARSCPFLDPAHRIIGPARVWLLRIPSPRRQLCRPLMMIGRRIPPAFISLFLVLRIHAQASLFK